MRASRLIVKHYYKGHCCFGSNAPPFEESAAAIETAIFHYETLDRALTEEWRAHREARRNEQFAAVKIAALAFAIGEKLRLQRRLRRQRREFGVASFPHFNLMEAKQ